MAVQKATYEVFITDRLETTVFVSAWSKEDAQRIARRLYNRQIIDPLEYSDYTSTDFTVGDVVDVLPEYDENGLIDNEDDS